MTFFASILRRIEIHCNRLSHPDLVQREAGGESPMMIAQEMLSRDLWRTEVFVEAYGTSVPIHRPVLSDYYMEHRRIGWSFAGTRRAVSQ